MTRWIWFGLGMICVGMGFVGFAIPGMPGIVFMIVAAWAFSKSSERWRLWVLTHPRFGKAVQDWITHGAISQRMKIGLCLAMVPTSILVLVFVEAIWLQIVIELSLVGTAIFLWTRPSLPLKKQALHTEELLIDRDHK